MNVPVPVPVPGCFRPGEAERTRVRRQTFVDLLDIVDECHPEGRGHFVCDNLSMHDTDDVWQWLDDHPRWSLPERDGGRCTYVDPEGRRCDSEGFLQLDHVEGFAREVRRAVIPKPGHRSDKRIEHERQRWFPLRGRSPQRTSLASRR